MARTGTDIPGGWGRWGAAGLFLALFQVLLRAENPDLMSDDGGEMIAASWTLGLPHPPGYPLFDLVGHLFSRLPLGSPAFRYNLLSGLFALGAVLLTAGLVLRLARREMGRGEAAWVPPALALASALALFFDGNFFAQALSAKGALYLSMALLAGGLAAGWLAREGKPLGRREQALVLFGWSLGISAHWETAVLFLPFLGLWFWLSRRRWTSKSLLLALTAGLLGLSPYLYLPLRAALHAWPSWGAPVTWTGFRWVVGRGLVSGHESFLHDWASYVGSAQRVGAVLAGGLPGAWVLVLVGWSAAWRQRWGWVGALGVLAAPVVAAVVAVREAQDIHYLLGAYLVSVSVPWVLFAFAGFRSLFDRLGTGGRWMGPALLAVALLALSIWGCRVLYLEGKADYSLADDLGKNALRGIPRGGLLVAGGDHYVMPVLYDQAVLGLRPDVLFVPDVFLAHQWGWEQITERRPDWGEGWKGQVLGRRWEWLVSKARASGGAYYALGPRYLDPVLAQAPGTWIPAGLARRWAKEDRPDEAAPSLAAMDGERYRGIEAGGPPPGLDLSSREIYRYYGDQYFQAAAWREVEGRPAPFFWDHGLAFDPGNGTALEHLARSQARAGNWELAARILRQAVEARPDSAAGWFNLAGIYSRAGLRTQAGDCWGRWSRLGGKGPLAVARSRTSPKSADYYAKLSRRYATMGLGFLALKAGETSRLLSRDPSGGEL